MATSATSRATATARAPSAETSTSVTAAPIMMAVRAWLSRSTTPTTGLSSRRTTARRPSAVIETSCVSAASVVPLSPSGTVDVTAAWASAITETPSSVTANARFESAAKANEAGR
jgi:hypothetical protein